MASCAADLVAQANRLSLAQLCIQIVSDCGILSPLEKTRTSLAHSLLIEDNDGAGLGWRNVSRWSTVDESEIYRLC